MKKDKNDLYKWFPAVNEKNRLVVDAFILGYVIPRMPRTKKHYEDTYLKIRVYQKVYVGRFIEGKTFKEVGITVNLSKERIRQICTKILLSTSAHFRLSGLLYEL